MTGCDIARKADKGEVGARTIKLRLSHMEHDRVHLAAALKRQPIGEFIRIVVLDATDRATKGAPFEGRD